MPRIVCANCGEIDHALVDGYPFGDTLLEGVMFVIQVKLGGVVAEPTTPGDASYLDDLNATKWLTEAARFASETDCDSLQCPQCKESDGIVTLEGINDAV